MSRHPRAVAVCDLCEFDICDPLNLFAFTVTIEPASRGAALEQAVGQVCGLCKSRIGRVLRMHEHPSHD